MAKVRAPGGGRPVSQPEFVENGPFHQRPFDSESDESCSEPQQARRGLTAVVLGCVLTVDWATRELPEDPSSPASGCLATRAASAPAGAVLVTSSNLNENPVRRVS
jgi:hypothetical protein